MARLAAYLLGAAIALVSCSQPATLRTVADTGTSTLKNRIPPAEPAKYRSVADARDWQNPYLMVQAVLLRDALFRPQWTDGRLAATLEGHRVMPRSKSKITST
jgi:hypothetical protein